jgi:outer membrane protein assembly factor BamB
MGPSIQNPCERMCKGPRIGFCLALALCIALCIALCAAAENAAPSQHGELIRHRIMFAEYGKGPNRLVELDRDGKLVWENPLPSVSVIFDPLPNGHVIYAYGGGPTGVQEVDRDHNVVWNYVSKCPQVIGFSRLPNGNILVGEQGPCRAVEINRKGETIRSVPLSTSEVPYHRQVRNLHKLPNGNILAGHEGEGAVREVDPTGKVVWEFTQIPDAPEALRLKNGNTLIACGTQKRLIEVERSGKIVWEFGPADVPDLNLTWVASLQILKNGNVVVGNFIRGQEGKGVHAFEVTRDKKVVWRFADHERYKSITTIRVLD